MKYVMLSSNLKPDTQGHFLPFHKSIYEGFIDNDFDVTYLGGESNSQEEDWFRPVLSAGLNKPIPWASYNSFSKQLRKATIDKNFAIVVFEGNLTICFLTVLYLMRFDSGVAIVNQFRGDKISKKLIKKSTGILSAKIYKLLVKASKKRLVLTSDNSNFQTLLAEKLKLPIERFPMFSPLSRKRCESVLGHKVLILVRGSVACSLLLNALLKRNASQTYVVHGIPKERLLGERFMEGIEVLDIDLPHAEYRKAYLQFNAVIIMYSPEDFTYVSSGRLYDALRMGIPVYAPRGTSMASELEEDFIFDFQSEEELVNVLNQPMKSEVVTKNLDKFTVGDSVAELVRLSKIQFSESLQASEFKAQSLYALTLRGVWIAYGCFSFVLFRGFIRPRIFIDSAKMRIKAFSS